MVMCWLFVTDDGRIGMHFMFAYIYNIEKTLSFSTNVIVTIDQFRGKVKCFYSLCRREIYGRF